MHFCKFASQPGLRRKGRGRVEVEGDLSELEAGWLDGNPTTDIFASCFPIICRRCEEETSCLGVWFVLVCLSPTSQTSVWICLKRLKVFKCNLWVSGIDHDKYCKFM